jgi:mono/diheme cytochrome c family protein
MRVFRSFTVMTAILVCGLVVAGARAQAQQQPPQGPPAGGRQGGAPPQNLQVLPKDTPRQQLTQIMRGYMSAVGAQNCNVCHTDDMAQRASDDNPKKGIARKMIQMTMDLNKTLEAVGTPAADGAPKVTCFTCHRGAAKPLTAPAAGGF